MSGSFVPICQNDSVKTSILIVCEDDVIAHKIQEGLMAASSEYNPCLYVHVCESVHQLLTSGHPISPDYVAFVINPFRFQVLKMVENGIKKLSKAFLLDRVGLVVDTSQGENHSFVPNILEFKQKYQMHVLWGDVQRQCPDLCMRLFNLVTAICGTFTGFPFITIHDRYTSKDSNNECTSNQTAVSMSMYVNSFSTN